MRLDPLRRPYFAHGIAQFCNLSLGSQTSAVPGCDCSSRSATPGDHEEDQFFFVILRAFVVEALTSVAAHGQHEHVIDVHLAHDRADLVVNIDIRRRDHGRHHRLQRVPAGFHFHLGPGVIASESDLRVLGVALQASHDLDSVSDVVLELVVVFEPVDDVEETPDVPTAPGMMSRRPAMLLRVRSAGW